MAYYSILYEILNTDNLYNLWQCMDSERNLWQCMDSERNLNYESVSESSGFGA